MMGGAGKYIVLTVVASVVAAIIVNKYFSGNTSNEIDLGLNAGSAPGTKTGG
jgi:hypothetical protein